MWRAQKMIRDWQRSWQFSGSSGGCSSITARARRGLEPRVDISLNRGGDGFCAQAQVIQYILGLAAALGDLFDVKALDLDAGAFDRDGRGDFGFQAAGVVVFDGDDRAAVALGDIEDG